jgi:hypothetical protein
VELPPALTRPKLGEGLAFYWGAFLELSSCRSIGFGVVGQIPWLAIRAYAQDRELDDEDADYFLAMIRALDGVYLAHMNKGASDG